MLSVVVNVCMFVRGAGVASACGWHDGRRVSWRQCQRRTAAVNVGGSWCDGAASHREGPAGTAAARTRPARSQVSEGATAAVQQRCRRLHRTSATSMHAAQLCQHEERSQAHDHLQSGQELHR